MAENEKIIWDFLNEKIGNAFGTAGMMGNLYAESNLNSVCLQNSKKKELGMTDEEYTSKVDDGSYTNFINDSAGYGLAQWTYCTRKEGLLEHAKETNKSVGDLTMQLEYFWKELSKGYSEVLDKIKVAKSVMEASNVVMKEYEQPEDQSKAVQEKRASFGQVYYDKFAETNWLYNDIILKKKKIKIKKTKNDLLF